jgi:hypothetical protein
MANRKELMLEFDRMEGERQTLIKRLQVHSSEVLRTKPDSSSWSVAEVFDHLKTAENSALLYMNKKLEFGGHQKAPFSAAIRQRLLSLAVALPIKYKAPKFLVLPTVADLNYDTALDQWNEVRARMKDNYERLDEGLIGNDLFKHPSGGKMNVVHGARFMRQHMNHHISQIDRILKAVAK